MKLLFVDPSKSFQQVVSSLFADAEIEISFVEDQQSALLRADEDWGFVCTALHLPDGSGLALCRDLRGHPAYQHTPIILFTADASEGLLQEAAQVGATEVFLKSNLDELVNFVGRYMARKRKIEGRILYVEDSPSQALAVQSQLARLGLSVEWCGSGEDAWTAFQKREYDLVLTDIILAGAISGATLISRIRRLGDARGDTPIIAITAFDQLARRIELFHLGVSDYVAKPIVEEELASRVRNLIERRKAEQVVKRQEKRRFDDTLLYLSRTLNTAGGNLTDTLADICRRSAEVLEVPRVAVWLLADDRQQLVCRARHEAGNPDAPLSEPIHQSTCPAYFDALLGQRIIAASDAWTHPATQELSMSYLVPQGIGALLDVPLGTAEKRIGVLCHEHLGGSRDWSTEEESFAAGVGDLVALAIEAHQRWLADQQLRLAGLVFEAAAEAIVICDHDNRIVTANEAFTAITGYALDEIAGKSPAMFKSGRHDEHFYAAMWKEINTHNKWQGEIWDRKKDGTLYLKRLSITRVLDATGAVAHYIAVFTDISKEKDDQERLRYLAYNDVLTQLPNRVYAENTLATTLDAAERAGQQAAVMCIDIDRFNKINSSFGHGTGDALLREVAQRLQGALSHQSHLARWSGASFIAILNVPAGAELAADVAQRCIDACRRPFVAGANELSVTLSLGIGLYPRHGRAPSDLIKNAMTALGHAKDNGGNSYVFFNSDMETRTIERLMLESRLRRAIEQQQFILHYQPKVNATSHALTGFEALVRWNDPVEGLKAPGAFLGLAEDTGQIYPINDWVLHEACRQNAEWHSSAGLDLPVSVNLPAGAFSRRDVVADVRRVLTDTGLPPALLELELTESAMVDDPLLAIEVFGALKRMGVRIAIDDFGTGYSSLAYLRRFPIDILKIDRSFIANLDASEDELVIVSSIIGLAKSLRLETIAEGIEHEQQAAILRRLGCDGFQGYLFGRPMTAPELLCRARS